MRTAPPSVKEVSPVNSIIQSLKHAARGLPGFQSFRNRVLFLSGKRDLPSAWIYPPAVPAAPKKLWRCLSALGGGMTG